jgi:hypothetical protein
MHKLKSLECLIILASPGWQASFSFVHPFELLSFPGPLKKNMRDAKGAGFGFRFSLQAGDHQ